MFVPGLNGGYGKTGGRGGGYTVPYVGGFGGIRSPLTQMHPTAISGHCATTTRDAEGGMYRMTVVMLGNPSAASPWKTKHPEPLI